MPDESGRTGIGRAADPPEFPARDSAPPIGPQNSWDRLAAIHPPLLYEMISHLDHLALTTANEAACVDFHTRVLGKRLERYVGGTPPVACKALTFGGQKINLHIKGREFEPKADVPTPGAHEFCFIAALPPEEVIAWVQAAGWPIVEGPVQRTGANGPIRSIYLRDPDRNLVELSEPVHE